MKVLLIFLNLIFISCTQLYSLERSPASNLNLKSEKAKSLARQESKLNNNRSVSCMMRLESLFTMAGKEGLYAIKDFKKLTSKLEKNEIVLDKFIAEYKELIKGFSKKEKFQKLLSFYLEYQLGLINESVFIKQIDGLFAQDLSEKNRHTLKTKMTKELEKGDALRALRYGFDSYIRSFVSTHKFSELKDYLHHTQFLVGPPRVNYLYAMFQKMNRKQIAKFINDRPFPFVYGIDGRKWMIDGHHSIKGIWESQEMLRARGFDIDNFPIIYERAFTLEELVDLKKLPFESFYKKHLIDAHLAVINEKPLKYKTIKSKGSRKHVLDRHLYISRMQNMLAQQALDNNTSTPDITKEEFLRFYYTLYYEFENQMISKKLMFPFHRGPGASGGYEALIPAGANEKWSNVQKATFLLKHLGLVTAKEDSREFVDIITWVKNYTGTIQRLGRDDVKNILNLVFNPNKGFSTLRGVNLSAKRDARESLKTLHKDMAKGFEYFDADYIPLTPDGLTNSYYRGLAWLVRESHAYDKSSVPFAEFFWADYFKRRMNLDKEIYSRANLIEAIELAIEKNNSTSPLSNIEGLPGFIDNNTKSVKSMVQDLEDKLKKDIGMELDEFFKFLNTPNSLSMDGPFTKIKPL